jgi:hypothetical protein
LTLKAAVEAGRKKLQRRKMSDSVSALAALTIFTLWMNEPQLAHMVFVLCLLRFFAASPNSGFQVERL